MTAQELRTVVWPDSYVSEGLLRVYIRDVRRALGDEAERPTIIETIPRRGYCVERTGERWWEAEIYRLRGELLFNAEHGMQNDEQQTKKKG